MKLSKIQTQVYTGTGVAESSLQLTVEYNPATKEVEQIISAIVFNEINRACTDITSILYEQFGSPLESMVESIDWAEVYAEVMADRKELDELVLEQ